MYIVGTRDRITNLEHRHHACVDVFVLRQLSHTREVYVEVRSGFGYIKQTTHCGQELAHALDFLFLGVFRVCEEFLDALVHNTLRQHLQLEELANETDEAQSATSCLDRSRILVRVQFRLLTSFLDSLDLRCRRSDPTTLEVLLTAIEQILSEQITACDRLALGILDDIVLNLWVNLLHHLAT